MVDGIVRLIMLTLNGMRLLLPCLLVAVVVVVVWIDRPVFFGWPRPRNQISVGHWIAHNFWILVGFALATYLAWHYPRDPW